MVLSSEEQKECVRLLRNSVLLSACTEEELTNLSKVAVKRIYKRGEILTEEGQPQNKMFMIADGSVVREKTVDGRVRYIDTFLGGHTVGSLHIMNKDPAFATTKCHSNICVTYELSSEFVNETFRKNPNFAWNVTNSLMHEVRRHTRTYRTPLLEQKQSSVPFIPVSIAASIESFYRAALNSILNQQLTGVKMGSLFPNMHIQIPTRVIYINGLKGIRHYLDSNIHPQEYENPQLIRLMTTLAPGVLMTPVSSVLEASNAGHANPEPIYRRWMRGLIPRCGREVIFGIGLNQLSDYCEERVPYFENQVVRNAVGSLAAGVISGYFSHVVHNMSTLKLMNPNKSYRQHLSEYVKKSEGRIPAGCPESLRPLATYARAFLTPTGVHIRTSQIVGSFIILNGTIHALHGLEVKWK